MDMESEGAKGRRFLDSQPFFKRFFDVIESDGRIGPVHIAVYMALLFLWEEQHYSMPIQIFSKVVMPRAKISGISTYYKALKELDSYGYIRYISTYDRVTGSMVYLLELK